MSNEVVRRARERKSQLKEERTKLLNQIESLQKKLNGLDSELGHLDYLLKFLRPRPAEDQGQGSGSRSNPTMIASIVKILEREAKALTIREIRDRLAESGYKFTSKRPMESVRSILYVEKKRKSPRVIRLDKKYGLPGWDRPSDE